MYRIVTGMTSDVSVPSTYLGFSPGSVYGQSQLPSIKCQNSPWILVNLRGFCWELVCQLKLCDRDMEGIWHMRTASMRIEETSSELNGSDSPYWWKFLAMVWGICLAFSKGFLQDMTTLWMACQPWVLLLRADHRMEITPSEPTFHNNNRGIADSRLNEDYLVSSL